MNHLIFERCNSCTEILNSQRPNERSRKEIQSLPHLTLIRKCVFPLEWLHMGIERVNPTENTLLEMK